MCKCGGHEAYHFLQLHTIMNGSCIFRLAIKFILWQKFRISKVNYTLVCYDLVTSLLKTKCIYLVSLSLEFDVNLFLLCCITAAPDSNGRPFLDCSVAFHTCVSAGVVAMYVVCVCSGVERRYRESGGWPCAWPIESSAIEYASRHMRQEGGRALLFLNGNTN